jgi:hypothetical protein
MFNLIKLSILCLWCLAALGVQHSTAQTRALRFDRYIHQFGNIKEADGVVSTTFTFTNVSDTIVTIQKSWASCGCTTPQVTKTPLKPGEQGVLEVQYNPKGRPGKFRKKIRLVGTGIKQRTEVYIEGKVQPHPYPIITGALRWKNTFFNFNTLYYHQTDTLWLPFTNASNAPVTLLTQQAKLPKGLQLLVLRPTLAPEAQDSLGLVWNAAASGNWGFTYHTLHIPLSQASGKNVSIALQATAHIKEDFARQALSGKSAQASLGQDSLVLGNIKPEGQAEGHFLLTNTGNEVLHIRQIKTSCKCLTATLETRTLVPGSSTQILVRYGAMKTQLGAQQMLVMLTVNDPKKPLVRLKVQANIQKKTK